MAASVRSLNVLGALALHLSTALAHPTSRSALQSDHHHHSPASRRAVDLEAFRLKNTPETYVRTTEVAPEDRFAGPSLVKKDEYVDTATALVQATAPGAEFRLVNDHYVGANGIGHVYFKQTVHGIDVDNADFTVNIAADGSVFSYANGFYTGTTPSESPLAKRDFSSPEAALTAASNTLDLPVTGAATAEPTADDHPETYTLTGTTGAVTDPQARLVYFIEADNSLALTWRIETDVYDDWLLTYVDASSAAAFDGGGTPPLHGVVNYRADLAPASYLVYPWGVNDPTEGERALVESPWDLTTSEFTFQGDSTTSVYNATRGNNGVAQVNPTGATASNAWVTAYRPSSADLEFVYDYDPAMTDPVSYRDAAVTQLFYTANVFHDVLYALGFTEAAGNFETNNNGQGGAGDDMVILNAQDGSGTNNANFATPPDGQKPRMRMYLWTRATPSRDCAFEAGVVLHEFTHGLSNRLTGGPANSGCLSALESGGMGEGWSDFYATAIRLKANDTRDTDYAMGAWVANDEDGIRAYRYSTSLERNPLTYASVDALTSVHAIGTVWATILYEALWNLIDKAGLSVATMPVFDGLVPTDGKFLALKLVTDGLALQPCNPNFVDARDAILDADVALTGGDNACELWTAFAKRGLGAAAQYSSTTRTESFDLPAGVC